MEGCGLSVIEAMAAGAAVIGSNCSSVPEVICNQDHTFDPYDPLSIKNKIDLSVNDLLFYKNLKLHSSVNYKKFSWNKVANNVEESLSEFVKVPKNNTRTNFLSVLDDLTIKCQDLSSHSDDVRLLKTVFQLNFAPDLND